MVNLTFESREPSLVYYHRIDFEAFSAGLYFVLFNNTGQVQHCIEFLWKRLFCNVCPPFLPNWKKTDGVYCCLLVVLQTTQFTRIHLSGRGKAVLLPSKSLAHGIRRTEIHWMLSLSRFISITHLYQSVFNWMTTHEAPECSCISWERLFLFGLFLFRTVFRFVLLCCCVHSCHLKLLCAFVTDVFNTFPKQPCLFLGGAVFFVQLTKEIRSTWRQRDSLGACEEQQTRKQSFLICLHLYKTPCSETCKQSFISSWKLMYLIRPIKVLESTERLWLRLISWQSAPSIRGIEERLHFQRFYFNCSKTSRKAVFTFISDKGTFDWQNVFHLNWWLFCACFVRLCRMMSCEPSFTLEQEKQGLDDRAERPKTFHHLLLIGVCKAPAQWLV